MDEKTKKQELEKLVGEEFSDHPSLRKEPDDYPATIDWIWSQYRLITHFAEISKPEGQQITEDEDTENMRKAASLILNRRKGKVLVLGRSGFIETVHGKLSGKGFRVVDADRLSKGFGKVYREKPAVVLVEKEMYTQERFSNEAKNMGVDIPLTVMSTTELDFEESRFAEMVSTLDKVIKESTRKMAEGSSVVLIDEDPLGNELAEALRTKGIDARFSPTEEDACRRYFDIEPRISISELGREQKRFMIEAARNPDYNAMDMIKILRHAKEGKPTDFRTVLRYAKALRDFRLEQFVMRYFCLYSGDMMRVSGAVDEVLLSRFGSNKDNQHQEIMRVAARNALQYYLNEGSGADLHNRLMSKAFGEGYREFLLGRGKMEGYLTDETFMDYIIKNVIEYMKAPSEEFAGGILTKDELESLRKSVEEQLKITDQDRDEKLEILDSYFTAKGIESKRLYRNISFEQLVEALGGKEKAKDVRKKIGERFKEVMMGYLEDEDFGPRDLSSIIRKEDRIHVPGRNPVFKIEADVMGIGSVDAIVKIFDYREDMSGRALKESARRKKKNEFRKEVRAADYFSRWGINRAVHFFFEEYDEFSAIMMRYWGENNLFDVVKEMNELIESEEARGDAADIVLMRRWYDQKTKIFFNLVERMAYVHAFSPDISSKISDPTEDFEESLVRTVFRRKKKGEMHLLWPFEEFGPQQLCSEVRRILARLRQICPAFAEYLKKAQPLQDKVACKDTALRNWFLSGSGFKTEIRPTDFNAIDYGTIRNLPPQMDAGNAFVMGTVTTESERRMYSRTYFKAYEREVKKYNKKLDEIASNIAAEAKKQFSRADLCRKGARKYLKLLSEYIESRLSGAADEQNTKLTPDGRINGKIMRRMCTAFNEYLKELESQDHNISSADISDLKMFRDNAVRFFKSLKRKKEYLGGGTTKDEEERRFESFMEGMLASMPYKTMRNLRAYVGFIMAQQGHQQEFTDSFYSTRSIFTTGNPVEIVGSMGEMAIMGVNDLERFLGIYKQQIGRKTGGYDYTEESYDKISQIANELRKFAACCGKLKDYMAAPAE